MSKSWEVIAECIKDEGRTLRHNRVAVLPDEISETYLSNEEVVIYRPEMAKGNALCGTVVAVGVGEDVKNTYSLGDRLYYNKYNIVEFVFNTDDGEEYNVVVLHDRDIYWSRTGV